MNTKKNFAVLGTAAAMMLALSACGGGAGSAGGDAQTLRLALNQTETHPSYVALDNMGQNLDKGTEGKLSVDVHANETLGKQKEVIQLVSDGTVEMAVVSGTQLENLNPDFQVFNLPGVFDSVEHQMGVLGDDSIVSDLYASLEDKKITVLGGFTQGTRSIYNSKGPINTPQDLAGKKIRVQESDVQMKMIELMGGSPTPMAFGEVYTAMQSGVIDGAENNEISYITQKHNEVAKFFSTTNHLVGLDYVVINTDVYEAMSEDVRNELREQWAAAVDEHTALWLKQTDEAHAQLEASGTKFNDVDKKAFDSALEPLIKQYVDTEVEQKIYDAARAAAE